MKMFKDLSEEEEKVFRQTARQKYIVFTAISGVWHPVYQLECVAMNAEAGLDTPLVEIITDYGEGKPLSPYTEPDRKEVTQDEANEAGLSYPG